MEARDPETKRPLCHFCHMVVWDAPGMAISTAYGFYHIECLEMMGGPEGYFKVEVIIS